MKVEHAPVDRARTPAGSFAPIVQKVAPSVVEVFVTSKAAHPDLSNDQMDMFRRFFGQQGGHFGPDGARRFRAEAAGPRLRRDRFFRGLYPHEQSRHQGRQRDPCRAVRRTAIPAKLVGADPKTDVALIKIKADGLPALTFADSGEISVGDVVLAVGNPFGIGQTVTQGIISAKDRVTEGDMDEDFLQTDAAINPGNSGGALVDTEGRLVGINAQILQPERRQPGHRVRHPLEPLPMGDEKPRQERARRARLHGGGHPDPHPGVGAGVQARPHQRRARFRRDGGRRGRGRRVQER